MGDFRIEVNGVGAHGCQREVKSGEVKKEDCGNAGCPDCLARAFVKKLKDGGNSIQSATLMHWPQNGPQIVDDLQTGKRTGSF